MFALLDKNNNTQVVTVLTVYLQTIGVKNAVVTTYQRKVCKWFQWLNLLHVGSTPMNDNYFFVCVRDTLCIEKTGV